MVIDRAGEDVHQDGPIVVNLDDPRDRRIRVLVADDEMDARAELDTRRAVPHVRVRQTAFVGAVIVDP
jgi:hypothetical protein